jgi:hypothetical protein
MFASSYVPGTLALIGSPLPDVFQMMNCALAATSPAHTPLPPLAASAFRGLTRNDAGSPVASARRPIMPAPNNVE